MGDALRRVLRKGTQQFNILEKREIQPDDKFKEFRDKTSALNFLRGLMRDNSNTIILRNLVKRKLSQSRFSSVGERKVIENLASQLVSGQIRIAVLPVAIPSWSYEEAVIEEVEEPAAVVEPVAEQPHIVVTNLRWGQKEARRGDVVNLYADIDGVDNGTTAMLSIFEYDRDGSHDFIERFNWQVNEKKIEANWEFEYHEDIDEIPTQKELEKYGKSYNPPEYFFTVTLQGQEFGAKQESGLLEFKDWIEIELFDQFDEPVANAKFIVRLADGSEIEGSLDENGYAWVEDVPPGQFEVQFPDDEEDI
jgi:hypothetical protein